MLKHLEFGNGKQLNEEGSSVDPVPVTEIVIKKQELTGRNTSAPKQQTMGSVAKGKFRWTKILDINVDDKIVFHPSYRPNEGIVLTWDSELAAYYSVEKFIPCGSYEGQLVIGDQTYDLDFYDVKSYSFEVDLYIKEVEEDNTVVVSEEVIEIPAEETEEEIPENQNQNVDNSPEDQEKMDYTTVDYTSKYRDYLKQNEPQRESSNIEDTNISRYSQNTNMQDRPNGDVRPGETIHKTQTTITTTTPLQQQNTTQQPQKHVPLFQRNFFKMLSGNPVTPYQVYSLKENDYERAGPTEVGDRFYGDKDFTDKNISLEPVNQHTVEHYDMQQTPLPQRIASETVISHPSNRRTTDTVTVNTSELELNQYHTVKPEEKIYHAPFRGPIMVNRATSPIIHLSRSKTPPPTTIIDTKLADNERRSLEDTIAALRKLLQKREDELRELQKQMLNLRDMNRSLKEEIDHLKLQNSSNTSTFEFEKQLIQVTNERDILSTRVIRLNDEIQYLKTKNARYEETNSPDINALLKKIAELESVNRNLSEANEITTSELARKDKQLAEIFKDQKSVNINDYNTYINRYKIHSNPPNTETYKLPLRAEHYKSPLRSETFPSPPRIENYRSTTGVERHNSPPRVENYSSPPRVESYSSPTRAESYSSLPSYVEHYRSPLRDDGYKLTNDKSYTSPAETYKSRYSERQGRDGYSRNLEETVTKIPSEFNQDRREVNIDGGRSRLTTTEYRGGMPQYRSRSAQNLSELSHHPHHTGVDYSCKSSFPDLNKYSTFTTGGQVDGGKRFIDGDLSGKRLLDGDLSDTPTDTLITTGSVPLESMASRSKPQWKRHSVDSDSDLDDQDEGYHTIYRKRSKSVLGRGRYDDALQTTPTQNGHHHVTLVRPTASMEGLAPVNHKLTPYNSNAGYRSILPKPLITQQNKHLYSSSCNSTGTGYLSNSITQGMRPYSPSSPADIQTNDIVKFSRQGGKLSLGSVRFIGHLPGRSGIFLGVELNKEEGKHDGTYCDVRYFKCKPNKGVFVAFNKVVMGWTS